jgi:hypothetical protein
VANDWIIAGTCNLNYGRGDLWRENQRTQLVRPGKERTGQGRIVPAYAPASVRDYVHRSMGGRKRVIEELALARQHLSPSVEE